MKITWEKHRKFEDVYWGIVPNGALFGLCKLKEEIQVFTPFAFQKSKHQFPEDAKKALCKSWIEAKEFCETIASKYEREILDLPL